MRNFVLKFYHISSEGGKMVLKVFALSGVKLLRFLDWRRSILLPILCLAINKLSSFGSGGKSSSWNDQLMFIFEPGLNGVRDTRWIHVATLCQSRVQNWISKTKVYSERNAKPRKFVFRTWSFFPCAMIVSMIVSHSIFTTVNIIRPVLRSSTSLSLSSSLWLKAACSGKRQTVRSFSQNFASWGSCETTGALSSSIRAFLIFRCAKTDRYSQLLVLSSSKSSRLRLIDAKN